MRVGTGCVLYACLACALLGNSAALSEDRDPEVLHGWGGDSFSHSHVFGSDDIDVKKDRWIETLSWHPRAFLFHNFMSHDEADELVVQAAPQMKRSTVVGDDKASSSVDNIRTSYGTFLGRLSSPAVERLEKKLANWTQIPIVHQEDVQILRYEHGQKYGAHYDSLGRICTVLVYLTDVEEGGETAFPKTTDDDWADPSQASLSTDFSECAKGHVAGKPKKGDALLFYSLKPDGQTADNMAMHTGCPLIKGIKWTVTIWIHPTPFRPDDFHNVLKRRQETGRFDAPTGMVARDKDPGVCVDAHPRCQEWAASGECEKNPGYMKGVESETAGACRLSCHICTKCAQGDDACYFENRKKAGYLHLVDEVRQLTGHSLPTQFK